MSSTESSSTEKASAVDAVPEETISVEIALVLSSSSETAPDKASSSKDASANVPASSTKKADILSVASHVIEHIDDFVTLTRLSMTCKLFKDLIDKHEKLFEFLFDRLEEGCFARYEMPSCQGNNVCRRTIPRDPLLANHITSPIARYLPTFGQQNWVPCYGCRKVKKRHDFPNDQVTSHFDLHSCSSVFRRCKNCVEEKKRIGKMVWGRRSAGRYNESDPVKPLWHIEEVDIAEGIRRQGVREFMELEIQDVDW